MPRIEPVKPPYSPDIEARLKAMMRSDRGVDPLRIFRTFVRNPSFVEAMGPMGAYFLRDEDKGGAAYDVRSRELVIDRVCARCNCEYEWGVHVSAYRKQAELSDEQVYALVHEGAQAACWSPKDRAAIELVDALHDRGRISDDLYTRLESHFSERQIMELMLLAGWYHAISYFANGLEIDREEWALRFPEKRLS
jgi:alkylhydroperoxidase family enzyme